MPVITGTENNDNPLNGTALDDEISGLGGNDVIFGGGGNDGLYGGAGVDQLYGGDGNDHIDYRSEDSIVDGEGGIDVLQADDASGVSTVDLSNTTDQVVGGGIARNFENVNFQWMSQNVSITGSAGNNFLIASNGNDFVNGGAGADTIYAHWGNDRVLYDSADVVTDGGVGIDTLVLVGAAGFNVDLRNPDQVAGGGSTNNFENVDGSQATGGSIIIGSAGANEIKGTLGADQIFAHYGNDSVFYDPTDAIIDGGTEHDTLMLTGSSSIAVNLAAPDHTAGDAGSTSNFESVDAQGMTASVTITGSSGDNWLLRGGAGNDTIDGGAGDDQVVGGAGVDYLYGGDGNDSIDYRSEDAVVDGGIGAAGDWLTIGDPTAGAVNLSNLSDQVAGGGVAVNFEHVNAQWMSSGLTITGSSIGNYLFGGAGNDTIYGEAGNDTIRGGDGRDYLWGGDGVDVIESGNGSATDPSAIWGGTGADIVYGGNGLDAFGINAGDVPVGQTEYIYNWTVYNDARPDDYWAGTGVGIGNVTTVAATYDAFGSLDWARYQLSSGGLLEVDYVNVYS